MAWQDEQPPWGKGGRTPSPEEFIADLLKKLKQTFGGGGSSAPPGIGRPISETGFDASLAAVIRRSIAQPAAW